MTICDECWEASALTAALRGVSHTDAYYEALKEHDVSKESTIQRNIIRYLRERGAHVTNVHGSQYQSAGTPDLLVCYQGRFVAFEVKRPGQKLTPLQEHVMAQIREAGGQAHRVESIEDVKEILR